MTSIEELQARVDKGAAWLDEVNPGWWDRVVINKLHMIHSCSCVLGQLYADDCTGFQSGFGYAKVNLVPKTGTDNNAADFGFDVHRDVNNDVDTAEYGVLQTLWIEKINERRSWNLS